MSDDHDKNRGRPSRATGSPERRLLSTAEVVEQITASIESGEFKPGQPLPTQRALALRLHTSPGAVALAIKLLDARGIVIRLGHRLPTLVAGNDARKSSQPAEGAVGLTATVKKRTRRLVPSADGAPGRRDAAAQAAAGASAVKRAPARPGTEAVARQLTTWIDQGKWAPGDRLPSHKELARLLDATITITTRAIELLAVRGALIRQGAARPVLVAGEHVRRALTTAEATAQLTAWIADGTWGPGDTLPSYDELARRLHTTRATVSRALRGLVTRGTVIRQGRGRRVLVAGEHVRRAPSTAEAAEQLAAWIADGEWGPGAELPGQPELAARLHASTAVVYGALALLADRGTVTRQGTPRPARVGGGTARQALSATTVAEQMAGWIEARRLAPHQPLPSHVALAHRFGTSIRTVRRAIALLEERGKVNRQGPGRPALVADAQAPRDTSI